MTTSSYWLHEARDDLRSARFDGTAEVAVIGGGVTGCSCALTLAERGVHVRLHEAREIAGGASGRNGGFALRGAATAYDVREAGSASSVRVAWELTERSLDRIEVLAGDAFRRVGSLRLAADDTEWNALRGSSTRCSQTDSPPGGPTSWRAARPPVPRRDPPPVRRHAPAGALGQAARATPSPQAPTSASSSVRETSSPPTSIVVAGDGFTRRSSGARAAFVRRRGQVLATEPLAERLYERPHYARGGYDYWQQLPDGRLVIGGRRDAAETEETDVEETTPLVQSGSTSSSSRWSVAATRDSTAGPGSGARRRTCCRSSVACPGRTAWVAGGYSGHGNVLGLACGDLVARAILGEHRRSSSSSTRHGSRARRPARARRRRSGRRPARAQRARSRGPGSRGPSSRRA